MFRLIAIAVVFVLAFRAYGAYVPPTGLFGAITAPTTAATAGYNSWINQGSATETDSQLGMTFNLPSNGNSHTVSGMVKVAPVTPYTVTALLVWGGVPTQYNDANALIGWYDGSNAIDALALNPYAGTLSYSHNTYASYNAPVNAPTPSDSCSLKDIMRFGACSYPVMQPILPATYMVWVKLANNGTTVSVAAGIDGQNYQTLWSFPVSGGFLTSGYNNLIIGGDANFAQVLFTVASYRDSLGCSLASQMVFTTPCNSAMQSLI